MPTREEWNWYVLMLGQALLGAISQNVRMVSLKFIGGFWQIETVLEKPSAVDDEEFSDVADELSIFIEDIKDQLSDASYQRIVSKTLISESPLIITNRADLRVVFKRKENDL